MCVLLLDAYNLIYRARYGFMKGENATIFGFFRSLRPLIEKFNPDKAYFVLEGYPKHRFELAPDYKGTRIKNDDESFQYQRNEIISLMTKYFPIDVVRHPDYECDDVLANLIMQNHLNDKCIIISSDTDFLQLYNTHENVVLYNPIRKTVLPKPEFDYVKWKSLRGDGADNIKGIKGIGDKRATQLIENAEKLEELLTKNDNRIIFERNQQLIKFANIENLMDEVEISSPNIDWITLHKKFQALEFHSITNEKSWVKFQQTFFKLEKNLGVQNGN